MAKTAEEAEKSLCINPKKRSILLLGGKIMRVINVISYILVILGAINWGLFGLFNLNLVSQVFAGARSVGSIITYSLIALAALWLILSPFITDGVLWLKSRRAE